MNEQLNQFRFKYKISRPFMTTHKDKRLSKCHWLFTANQSEGRTIWFEHINKNIVSKVTGKRTCSCGTFTCRAQYIINKQPRRTVPLISDRNHKNIHKTMIIHFTQKSHQIKNFTQILKIQVETCKLSFLLKRWISNIIPPKCKIA